MITDVGEDAGDFLGSRDQAISDLLYVRVSKARHRYVLITTAPTNSLLGS